jgi:pimeloyl-ACP methyl ester carboxylesterase
LAIFVLVHGAWHDGSCWNDTIPHLERKSHKTFAPTIVGHGKGVSKDVNHAQCTQSVVDYIVERSLEGIILVGHSFGGTIISKVAEAIPERIRRLVFLCAFVLHDGKSLVDEIPPEHAGLFAQLARPSSDRSVLLPFPIWRDAFINDSDLPTAKWAYDQLSSQPYQPLVDKLDLQKFYALNIPKSYINCTEDTTLPGEWGWHPRMSARLVHYRLTQMPGSHEVMFTNPAGLAEKLAEAGRD